MTSAQRDILFLLFIMTTIVGLAAILMRQGEIQEALEEINARLIKIERELDNEPLPPWSAAGG